MKKYNILVNTVASSQAIFVDKDAFSLPTLLEQNAPLLIATDATCETLSAQKNVRTMHINVEKYSQKSTIKADFFSDLYTALSYTAPSAYAKKTTSKARERLPLRFLMSCLFSIIVIAIAFAVGAIAFHYTEKPSLFFASMAFISFAGALSLLLFSKRKSPIKAIDCQAVAQMLRNKRQQNVIFFSNIDRIEEDCQKELFRVLSSSLYFNPLYSIIIAQPRTIELFKNYFNIEKAVLSSPTCATLQAETSQMEGQPQAQMDKEEPPKQTEQPVEIKNSDIKKLPLQDLACDYDFESATPKAIINAIRDKEITLSPNELLERALPKLSKMTEKTLAEYLSVLSYTIKQADLKTLDISSFDLKTLQKLISYYNGENVLAEIMPLYQNALDNKNYLAISQFMPYITDKSAAIELVRENLYVDSSEQILSLISAISGEITPFLLEQMSAPKDLTALSLALSEVCEKFEDAQVTSLFEFISTSLREMKTTDSLKSIMHLIGKAKDKFRFMGLSTASFNDCIFNKEFASSGEKIAYIENLLLSNTLSDEEKNRYASFLTHSQSSLAPRDKMRVLTTLFKSGVTIEKDILLSCVTSYEENKSPEYLEELSALFHTYYNRVKDEKIFIDLACYFVGEEERIEILENILKQSPAASAKIVKCLLSKLGDESELFMEMHYNKVVLLSLGSFSEHIKFPKNEFIESICHLLEYQTSAKKFTAILQALIILYDKMILNGDQKHDLKSSMFRGAAKFNDDLSVITSCILKTFKIEYISFNEQKIAKQGDTDVALAVDELLRQLKGAIA